MDDQNRTPPTTRRGFFRFAGAGTAMAAAGCNDTLRAETAPPPLPHRALGKTGVQVPILGVGTAPAGLRSRKEASEFFSHCLDVGANYLDTAPSFAGYGVAQAALGDVLKTRRDEAFVVTKCWEPDGEKALKLLRSNLDELQIEQADIVYAHSIGSGEMDPAQVLGPRGVMKALEKAQRDGLVRFIGLSGHNRPARFLDVMKEFEIQVMMNAVNYVCRHIYNFEETVWPEASRRGVGLVAMKIYGGGAAKRGGRIKPPNLVDAFRYAQSLTDVSTVVVGMHDKEELEENIQFARSFEPLTETEMADLLDRGKRLAESWGEPFGNVV